MRINHKTNPAIAYKMGYETGLKESGTQGFMASNIMELLAYYNVIDNFVKTEKTQIALAHAIENEMNRLFAVEFHNDIDNIARAIEAVNTIRRKYKMEAIEWEWTTPQAASSGVSEKYREYLSKERK